MHATSRHKGKHLSHGHSQWHGNATQFWKRHDLSYPLLSKMAKVYLSVSLGSVPVESLFCTARQICSQNLIAGPLKVKSTMLIDKLGPCPKFDDCKVQKLFSWNYEYNSSLYSHIAAKNQQADNCVLAKWCNTNTHDSVLICTVFVVS